MMINQKICMCVLYNNDYPKMNESVLMKEFKEKCKMFCENTSDSNEYESDVDKLFKTMHRQDDCDCIYKQDFKRFCSKIKYNMSDNQMTALFDELNSQKLVGFESMVYNEYITKSEFLRFFSDELTKYRFDVIKDTFESLDKNEDGSITCKDRVFFKRFIKLGVDANNDKRISYNEFKKYYTAVSKTYTDDELFRAHMKKETLHYTFQLKVQFQPDKQC